MPYKEEKKSFKHILSIVKGSGNGSTDGTPDDGLAFQGEEEKKEDNQEGRRSTKMIRVDLDQDYKADSEEVYHDARDILSESMAIRSTVKEQKGERKEEIKLSERYQASNSVGVSQRNKEDKDDAQEGGGISAADLSY